jgi:hypothetical protein
MSVRIEREAIEDTVSGLIPNQIIMPGKPKRTI